LIEVFNRPSMALAIAKGFPEIPVIARLGNDARRQERMSSPNRRHELLMRCAEIHCSSEFIGDCFLDGVEASKTDRARVRVVYLGFGRPEMRPMNKAPMIVFVGRVLKEKGVLPLVEALVDVLPRHPQWSAQIIGARAFRPSETASPYEIAVAQHAARCPQIELAGFQTHDVAMQALAKASIAVVPSLWDEPFGRAGAEALASGCALIGSNHGGLREIVQGRGLALDTVNVETLSAALEKLLTNDAERARLQKLAWDDFPFDVRERVEEWDRRRDAMLASPAM
jgi:glycosyltransferase involved in cell wall biosynthesis